MAFREVRVNEVREVRRCWCRRRAAHGGGTGGGGPQDCSPVCRGCAGAGLIRENGTGQLSDELIGAVIAAVRPGRAGGHGAAWEVLLAHEAQIRDWVGKEELQLTNVHGKLTRRGVVVPYRTLHRFASERCRFGRRQPTVRVVDGEPGVECQLDFARLG